METTEEYFKRVAKYKFVGGKRNPKTAICWNCDKKYDQVYEDETSGAILGRCNQCDSIHHIVDSPKGWKRKEDLTDE